MHGSCASVARVAALGRHAGPVFLISERLPSCWPARPCHVVPSVQVFEHPWCKTAADDKRELLKVWPSQIEQPLLQAAVCSRHHLHLLHPTPRLGTPTCHPTCCTARPCSATQTMTRMRTSVRTLQAPPAAAGVESGDQVLLDTWKSGTVLDLEETVGGAGAWCTVRGIIPFLQVLSNCLQSHWPHSLTDPCHVCCRSWRRSSQPRRGSRDGRALSHRYKYSVRFLHVPCLFKQEASR